jgi:hypothetical protein
MELHASYTTLPASELPQDGLPAWLLTKKYSICKGLEQLAIHASWSYGKSAAYDCGQANKFHQKAHHYFFLSINATSPSLSLSRQSHILTGGTTLSP